MKTEPTPFSPFSFRGSIPCIRCPWGQTSEQCKAVPHIIGVATGRNVPVGSSSGPGLVIEYMCEDLHHWQIYFMDHSGGTWVSWIGLPDLSRDPRFADDTDEQQRKEQQ